MRAYGKPLLLLLVLACVVAFANEQGLPTSYFCDPVPNDVVLSLMEEWPLCAPQLIVVGAEKCGTTSIFEYLRAHPDFLAPNKAFLFPRKARAKLVKAMRALKDRASGGTGKKLPSGLFQVFDEERMLRNAGNLSREEVDAAKQVSKEILSLRPMEIESFFSPVRVGKEIRYYIPSFLSIAESFKLKHKGYHFYLNLFPRVPVPPSQAALARKIETYEGEFTHPGFGDTAVSVEMKLTSPTQGEWTATRTDLADQTEKLRIQRNGGGIKATSEDGVSGFDGHFVEDGVIRGEMIQEGKRGGEIFLRCRQPCPNRSETDRTYTEDDLPAHLVRNLGKVIGEASPQYLDIGDFAAQNILRDGPRTRLLILLREPMGRLNSQAVMIHHMAGSPRDPTMQDFEDNILRCFADLDGNPHPTVRSPRIGGGGAVVRMQEINWENPESDPKYEQLVRELGGCFSHGLAQFVFKGFYVNLLHNWLVSNKYPKEQILVLASEELYGDTVATMHRVARFAGLRRIPDEVWANAARYRYSPLFHPENITFTMKVEDVSTTKKKDGIGFSAKAKKIIQDTYVGPNCGLRKLLQVDWTRFGWHYCNDLSSSSSAAQPSSETAAGVRLASEEL